MTIPVERMCKLCKVRMESRKGVQGYCADRQMPAWLFTRVEGRKVMAAGDLEGISTFPYHLLLLLVL